MALITNNSIMVDDKAFFVGTNSYNTNTVPSGEVKITASDAADSDQFGWSVAVGSGRIVVGARFNDDAGSNSGSAYIFDLDGNQLAKITASDAAGTDQFGYSVAVGSGRIVVGAIQDDDDGSNSGSAYIFDLNGTQLTKITAGALGASDDNFGYSVAVGCGRIVVGAPEDDDGAGQAGSAYIFDLDGNIITKVSNILGEAIINDLFGRSVAVGCGRIVVGAPQTADLSGNEETGFACVFDLYGNLIKKFTSSDAAIYDEFGYSVAVGSGRIVVGAKNESADRGALYIFDLDGNQIAKITASDAAIDDFFGFSVAVGSGRIVVGAYGNDDNGSSSGSSYIFDLDGNQLAKITASDAAASDFFGRAVAVGSGRIVTGAYGNDDNGSNSGSAYIYTTPDQTHFLDILDD